MSETEFTRLWFHYRNSLYRSALESLRGDEYLADDAVGKLLIVLCRQRGKMPLETPGGFSFFAHSKRLLKYALCRVLTAQNRTKRRGVTVALDVATEAGQSIENPDVVRQGIERQREAAARAERLAQAASVWRAVELPELWARCYEAKAQGETFETIGRQLGITKQRACPIYHQAVKQMQLIHRQQSIAGQDNGRFWTGEQLHAWGSAVSVAF